MENRRYVRQFKNLIIYAVTIILLWPFFGLAYSEKTTHPALTDETVDFFNLNYPSRAFSDDEKEIIKTGSILEDTDPRYLHHFYDPVYNRGLTYIVGGKWSSSKHWAQSVESQAGLSALTAGRLTEYFSSDSDYTWERAIYDYVWKDKSRGLRALGQILHLIQDASVPDHTRNDPHPPVLDFGSPYEAWTAKFDDKNIDTLAKIKNNKPVIFADLGSYFDNMAKYSNNNFFSRDTIFYHEYDNPNTSYYEDRRLSNGLIVEFGYKKISADLYALVRVERNFNWENVLAEEEYFITDDDNLILTDYWSRLSKQSVLHGAGVIKLFFDEVEKEKQTKYLYNKNKSWFGKAWDWASGWFGSDDSAQTAAVITPEAEDEILIGFESGDADIMPPSSSTSDDPPAGVTSDVLPSGGDDSTLDDPSADVTSGVTKMPDDDEQVLGASTENTTTPGVVVGDGRDAFGLFPITILGGGGSGGSNNSQPKEISNEGSIETTPQNSESPPPQDQPATSTPPEPVDTTPPDLSFSVAECGDSLSQDGCLTPSESLTFNWESLAADLDEYELNCAASGIVCENFPINFASTSTSTVQNFETDRIYIFTLQAADINGNKTFKNLSVEIFKNPVVINEIAWMGVPGHPEDEYIELYNPTSEQIEFGPEWVLYSETDDSPHIILSGSIPAKGYSLIERKNTGETDEQTESPVKDVTADMWVSFGFGLKNSGEHLKLTRASSTVDEVDKWHAGQSGSDSRTMERFRENRPGTDSENWGSNNLAIMNGIATNDVPIRGTPKAKNSVSFQIATKDQIDDDIVITKARSPYIIPDEFFTINEDVTVTIEPGVIIKFSDTDGGRIYVEGILAAAGTASEPIVFTSIHDDEYGGDLAGNGTSTIASPGLIRGLWFKPESGGSVLDNVLIRYGGRYFQGNPMLAKAVVGVEEADITIKNSTIENSYSNGVALEGSSAKFENNIIQKNTDVGMRIEGGEPEISGNTFRENETGLRITEAPGAKIVSNIFEGNKEYAARSFGEIAEFSQNSGSGNKLGGIGISDDFLPDGLTTLKKNDIPYIIDRRALVSSGKTLTFESGAVFKGRQSNFPPGILIIEDGGRMFYGGATSSEIIFTSIYDDTAAGDSDNSTTTPVAGDWTGVEVADGGELDMSGFTIRYAGGKKVSQGDTRAGLRITGGAATTTNAVISQNKEFGIRVLDGGSLYIKDSELSNHTENGVKKGTGLQVYDSQATLENVSFVDNELDIHALGGYSVTCVGPCNATSTDPSPL